MLKKLLIIMLAFAMLSGCGKKKEQQDNQASPSPSDNITETQSTDNAEQGETNDDPEKTLAPADIKTGKTDPNRTPSIPETADPKKVIKESISPDKAAGSGVRASEVTDEEIKATSTDNAVKLAMQYMKNNNIYIPQKVELDREEEDCYVIHAYETIKDSAGEHTASVGWFKVDKATSAVSKVDEDIKVGHRPESYQQ